MNSASASVGQRWAIDGDLDRQFPRDIKFPSARKGNRGTDGPPHQGSA